MNKSKFMYLGIILLVIIVVTTICFSYGFFTAKLEKNGRLNVVAGTLNYKLESLELTNNTINIDANTIKVIDVDIISLNDIDSKYILYYETNNDDVQVVYDVNSASLPEGVINFGEKKTVTVIIKNNTDMPTNINFKIVGGLVNRELVLSSGKNINVDSKKVITFNTNGGTLDEASRSYSSGESIGDLPVPTNGLNYFAGWYLDDDFSTMVDSDYVVVDNVTLYARWYKYVDLYLASRTLGYPSNTAFSSSTSRTFDLNKYIVGISPDNYYNSMISNYNYSPPNFSVTVPSGTSGYGIGIPIAVTNSTYYFEGVTNDVYSFSFYKSNGEFISYQYLFENKGLVNVPSSVSVMILHMRGNEYKVPTTFSNPMLYVVE